MSRGVKVLFVFGTRPEAIKLAMPIRRMRGDARFAPRVCVTSQHQHMLEPMLQDFGVRADYDTRIMKRNQTLFDLTARGLSSMRGVLESADPDLVVLQGDTTTTLVGALAAFYMKIPIAHVEAGLRTNDKFNPFPEEMNRRLTTHLADLHFTPTRRGRDSLRREGVAPGRIRITGNTAVDALLFMRDRVNAAGRSHYSKVLPRAARGRQVILATAHRRESFGQGLVNICEAIREIALTHPGVSLVYPVHPNPNVQRPVRSLLSGLKNVHLIRPLNYESFVYLMMNCHFVLTDSGGIQEEAPALGKPVLVMRDVTERGEAVDAGVARLVGTDKATIVRGVRRLLRSDAAYRAMAGKRSPFGDGLASGRIIESIARFMGS